MSKADLRERIWDHLDTEGIARFPFPPHGRIPNFANASDAADRLADTDAWQAADTLKCNPDAPQLPVRRQALRDGKTIYMAVPRLSEDKPFLRLAPDEIDDIDDATTVSGSAKHGVPVDPEAMPHIDLIVAGSVAVDEDGNRVGKGEGFSDLEFAVLRGFDRVDTDTTVATSVHDSQVVDDEIEPDRHDVPLDLVVTPTGAIETNAVADRPDGLYWDDIAAEKIEEIPVLQRLQPE
ncbi:5-formyltetrahydrofolate cyclo-ligase [Halonotius terrestris]|uniref:5-formyltetrahydrofolate cyclo-ligase n=1 Tax=Halonotius terrestris TaxID=2487750 RepID=A0A8J8TC91_9EURY|nr:5-formyltetrahydrofolate cyclo-ligase [Halonotius terrestris]TQQ80948.1 5-formyltetrahydrofolate cyclo-ligase [Halonotius terrestris]